MQFLADCQAVGLLQLKRLEGAATHNQQTRSLNLLDHVVESLEEAITTKTSCLPM